MKVLYIGHYKEFGGWSQAAIDYILALDSAGVDVVCRNLTLTRDREDVPARILELEKKDSRDCNVCIQHVLPHHLVYTDKFEKNIAYFASETINTNHLNWTYMLSLMDEVWVANSDSKNNLEKYVNNTVKVVPHTTKMEKYKKQYKELGIQEALGKFKFYYIGDFNDRKNLESVITAYHSEFDSWENTALILKVNKFGKHPQELFKDLVKYTQDIKKRLRNKNRYSRDIIITEPLSQEQIYELHSFCDCFLCPSHGEAWSIPSFDAMAFGNTPICSNQGGPKDFLDSADWKTGTLLNGVYKCCKSQDAAFPDLFTSQEYWFDPCEKQLREQMRQYYNSYNKNPVSYKVRNKAHGLSQAEKYSYQNVAKLMMENLNAV